MLFPALLFTVVFQSNRDKSGLNMAYVFIEESSSLFKCIIYIHDPLIILAQVSELQETVCTVPVAAHHITNQSFRWVTENQSNKF